MTQHLLEMVALDSKFINKFLNKLIVQEDKFFLEIFENNPEGQDLISSSSTNINKGEWLCYALINQHLNLVQKMLKPNKSSFSQEVFDKGEIFDKLSFKTLRLLSSHSEFDD